jgi:macrolide-specific efflux system membrane fusion protein
MIRSKYQFRVAKLALFAALATLALSPAFDVYAADGSATGRLIFWRTSRIATPVMGVISSLPVRVGDQVKQGDVLAEIDTQQLKADLEIAQRALAFARSDLTSEEAKLQLELTEYDRQARLKESPAFSGARYEDSSNRVAVAKADVGTARATIATREAEVAKRELDVRLATIKAPFDGIVVRHLLTVGGLVSIETPHILIMVDNTSPEIEVEVPLEQVSLLTVGREVEFSIGKKGDREQARVRAVLPSEVPTTETRRVRLELMNAAARYSDSDLVTVYLPTS